MAQRRYRVGIDVGDRSVGAALVAFDDDGIPERVLHAVSYRHDGGIDPTTNKTPQSRKHTAGVARRVRRMRARRTKRLAALDRALIELGLPVRDVSDGETYEPWRMRARCVEGFIEDDAERRDAVSRALRHIARHRGWRNPWHSVRRERLESVPTATHQKNVAAAQAVFPGEIAADATVGQLGEVASRFNHMIRPRTGKKNPKQKTAVLNERVMQADQMAEVVAIWTTQRMPEAELNAVLELVFGQERPVVKAENIGRDELPGMGHLPRAPKASFEFQEFRIRATAATIGVRARQGSSKAERLDADAVDAVSHWLLEWDADDDPTWADVAVEALNLDPRFIKAPVFDDVRRMTAPVNRTARILRKALKKRHNAPVRTWWESASAESRAALVAFLVDPTDENEDLLDRTGLSDVVAAWPEEVLDDLTNLNYEVGRAAYSRESLSKMTTIMAEQRVGLHDARKIAFGVDDTWAPALPQLSEPTGQPTVDRVLPIVRRIVMAAYERYGVPEAVYIEHARSALLGPAARAEHQREVNANRREREKNRQILIEQGIDDPNRSDIRRWHQVQLQNCLCLYCGQTISAAAGGAELDHVVPRAGGGSNRRENLVAVCRQCNSEKGKLLFAVFAARTQREGVSVEAALERVRGFQWRPADRAVKRGLVHRLKQTAADDPIDERSLESTAYSAVEVRRRLERFYSDHASPEAPRPEIFVFGGSITSEARKAGGIDAIIRLRGKDVKDRFDARHHAVDAAVMTLVDRSVARTLQQRSDMRYAHRLTGSEPAWREHAGDSAAAQSRFAEWKKKSYRLAELLREAISADAIPVIFPLRLGVNRGSVHKDTVRAAVPKRLGDAWSAAELDAVVSPAAHMALSSVFDGAAELPHDDGRMLTVGKRRLHADDTISLLPGHAAAIEVNGGVVEIGESIHHARLVAWRDRKGVIQFGMVRVFTAEIPFMQRLAGKKDVFSIPVHPSTLSYRGVQLRVRKALDAGIAVELGWITQGDEIEIGLDDVASMTPEFRQFIAEIPEQRWRVDGFKDGGRLRVRPALLSAEGDAAVSDLVSKTLDKGSFVNAAGFIGAPSSVVIRRSALGVPRWRSAQGHLPVSFSPYQRAENLL